MTFFSVTANGWKKRRLWRPKWLTQGFQWEMSQWQLPYLANINNVFCILVVKMNGIIDLCKYLWRHEDTSFWFAVQDLRINLLLFNLWTVSHWLYIHLKTLFWLLPNVLMDNLSCTSQIKSYFSVSLTCPILWWNCSNSWTLIICMYALLK